MLDPSILILLAIVFSASVGFFAYRRQSISFSGLVALVAICGLFISFQDFAWLLILFSMFASSSLLSKYKQSQKADMERVVAKTGPRDAFQAFANLGVGVMAYIAFKLSADVGMAFAFLGSVAASNADSWASEIGGLSQQAPRMITTGKVVRKGLSGGVTFLGTLGGVVGALFISVLGLSIAVPHLCHGTLIVISSISGTLGFVFDSLLGATLQAKYRSEGSDQLTEHKGSNLLISGQHWMTNDMVNLLSSLFAACCAYLLYCCLF